MKLRMDEKYLDKAYCDKKPVKSFGKRSGTMSAINNWQRKYMDMLLCFTACSFCQNVRVSTK
jgi:hypothetical protein